MRDSYVALAQGQLSKLAMNGDVASLGLFGKVLAIAVIVAPDYVHRPAESVNDHLHSERGAEITQSNKRLTIGHARQGALQGPDVVVYVREHCDAHDAS